MTGRAESSLAEIEQRPDKFSSALCPQLIGLKAKLYAKKRHNEKIQMKKTIAQHSERNNRHKADDEVPKGAVPHYLLDREQVGTSPSPSPPSLVICCGVRCGSISVLREFAADDQQVQIPQAPGSTCFAQLSRGDSQ